MAMFKGGEMIYKTGDQIKILRTDIKDLEHRQKPVNGVVTAVDGAYILVKPSWCRWEIELYPNEIVRRI